MAQSNVVTQSQTTKPEKAQADYAKQTALALSKVDVSTLDDAQVKEYASACQEFMARAAKGGILCDPRNGLVYVGGVNVGNVNVRAKAKVLPGVFKPKNEEKQAGGEIVIEEKRQVQMWDALCQNTVACMRFMLSPFAGNSVNLFGQHGKTREEAIHAMASGKAAEL